MWEYLDLSTQDSMMTMTLEDNHSLPNVQIGGSQKL